VPIETGSTVGFTALACGKVLADTPRGREARANIASQFYPDQDTNSWHLPRARMSRTSSSHADSHKDNSRSNRSLALIFDTSFCFSQFPLCHFRIRYPFVSADSSCASYSHVDRIDKRKEKALGSGLSRIDTGSFL
jgi:hypothetical protein